MASRTKILVVSGLPCSGKSTLAKRISENLSWPLLAKDDFKEALFDTLGARDREWSRLLSGAAYELLFRQARALAAIGCGCILEGNFRHGEYEQRFTALTAQPADLIQAYCHAPPETLAERFRARVSFRHRGHVDVESLEEIEREFFSTVQRPLDLRGVIVDCDSSKSSEWLEPSVQRVLRELTN
jgi:predicted kinase